MRVIVLDFNYLFMWKDIEWYEGKYQVSNTWEIKSLDYNRQSIEKILLKSRDRKWYLFIRSYKNGDPKTFKVHRLVATYFIPNPENKPEVNHKDWNKLNNNDWNLEWNTSSENCLHAHRIWLRKNPVPMRWKFWKDCWFSKKVIQLTKEGILCRIYDSMSEAWSHNNISRSSISNYVSWKRKHILYDWKYL